MRKYIIPAALMTTVVVFQAVIGRAQPPQSAPVEAPPDPLQTKSLQDMQLLHLLSGAEAAAGRADSAARKAGLADKPRAEATLTAILDRIKAYQQQARKDAPNAPPHPEQGRYITNMLVSWAVRKNDLAFLDAVRARGFVIDADPTLRQSAQLVGLNPAQRATVIVESLATAVPPASASTNDRMPSAQELLIGADARQAAHLARARLKAAPALSDYQRVRLQAIADTVPLPTPTPPGAQGKTGRMDPKRGYLPPAPDRLPSLTPGQVFLAWGRAPLTLTDAVTGKRLERQSYVLRPLTLTRVEHGADQLRLTFSVPGSTHPIIWQGLGELYDLPDLAPVVEDANVRTLRARYVGHTVTGYGGIGLSGITRSEGGYAGFSLGGSKPVQIRALYRVRLGRPVVLNIGTSPGYSGERSSAFACQDPLVIVLSVPKGTRFDSTSLGGDTAASEQEILDTFDHLPGDPPMKASQLDFVGRFNPKWDGATANLCGFYNLCADTWDFERTCSLTPLEQISRAWPKRLRDAARQRSLVKGMTPLMVAWTIGWPGTYGTKESLMRNPNQWRYDDLPPHDFTVFFKQGRVSGWDRYQMP